MLSRKTTTSPRHCLFGGDTNVLTKTGIRLLASAPIMVRPMLHISHILPIRKTQSETTPFALLGLLLLLVLPLVFTLQTFEDEYQEPQKTNGRTYSLQPTLRTIVMLLVSRPITISPSSQPLFSLNNHICPVLDPLPFKVV